MQIAIIGAGFSGLALAWHLLQKTGYCVTLFDGKGIGGGASGAATGLMHPYAGKEARLSLYAHEGMLSTMELLRSCEEATSATLHSTGIFRHAINPRQMGRFEELATEDPEVELHSKGIFMKHGVTIYSKKYLDALFFCLQSRGAQFFQQKISCLKELKFFDKIFFAGGAGAKSLGISLPLKLIKGQALLCRAKSAREHSLVENGYLAITETKGIVQLGATYEREFVDDQPDLALAQDLLGKKMHRFTDQLEILGCRAGVRVMQIGRNFPLACQISERLYCLTAMGSKGLLYHSLLAKQLVDSLSCG